MKHQPKPLPPPFAVGTRLRYAGNRVITDGDDPTVRLLEPGLEVEIVETIPGSHGTGRILEIDDDGYEIVDTTQHGRSVWINARGQGRLIRPDTADEWEVIATPSSAR